MVKYLGKDFLLEALKKRQEFLSQSLLAVPTHLEELESYIHNGHVHDQKYRTPWKIVKSDNQYLQGVISSKSLVQNFWSEGSLDILENYETSSDDGINVIPNSNPSSPELSVSEKDGDHENIFLERFEKEISMLSKGHLMIEVLSREDNIGTRIQTTANLQEFLAVLEHNIVDDPLVIKQDIQDKAKDITKTIELLENKDDTEIGIWTTVDTGNIFKEAFEINDILNNKVNQIEDLVAFDNDHAASNMKTWSHDLRELMRDEKAEDVQDNGNIISNYQLTTKRPQDPPAIEKIITDNDPLVSSSFLEINKIVLSDMDIFCEKAIMDSPLKDFKLTVPITPPREKLKLHMEHVPSERSRILSESMKAVIERKDWLEEMFTNEIQASRLPEPDTPRIIYTALEPLKQCKLLKTLVREDNLGTLELTLSWEILSTSKKTTYGHNVMMIPERMSLSKEDCSIDLQKIEDFEKFSGADMYDWRDPLISIQEPKSSISITIRESTTHRQKREEQRGKEQTCYDGKLMKSWRPGQSHVDDFMILRGVTCRSQSVLGAHTSDEVKEKEIKQQKEDREQETVSDERLNKLSTLKTCTQSSNQPVVNKQSRNKLKHHTATVNLTEKFLQILNCFESAAVSPMKQLKESGDILQSTSFGNLPPDVTRFLLKQKEKALKDSNIALFQNQGYKALLLLHSLSRATDLVSHCCVESAIEYLTAVQEKYNDVLSGMLEEVRQKLFCFQAQFYSQQEYHPKVVALCRDTENWLRKKRLKSDDTDQKILIILKRDLPSLMNCLSDALAAGNVLSPIVKTEASSVDIIQCLDSHNCVISPMRILTESFPWAQFSLVVEYEHQDNTTCREHCERQNIRHMALKVKVPQLQESHGLMEKNEFTRQQLILIGSENISQNTQLLHLLESRYNFTIIQRDYRLLSDETDLYFSDLDVSETTCIILQTLHSLCNDSEAENLVTKMATLSLKYSTVWCLLHSDKVNSCQLPAKVVSNIARVEASAANFICMSKTDVFDFKIAICWGMEQLSCVIRRLSEACIQANVTKSDTQVHKLYTEEMRTSERFLLHLPCLSSFNAQQMIRTVKRRQMFEASQKQLVEKWPNVPPKVLMTLYKLINSDFGLHLSVAESRGEDSDLLMTDENYLECDVQRETQTPSDSSPSLIEISDWEAERKLPLSLSKSNKYQFLDKQHDTEPLLSATPVVPCLNYPRSGDKENCQDYTGRRDDVFSERQTDDSDECTLRLSPGNSHKVFEQGGQCQSIKYMPQQVSMPKRAKQLSPEKIQSTGKTSSYSPYCLTEIQQSNVYNRISSERKSLTLQYPQKCHITDMDRINQLDISERFNEKSQKSFLPNIDEKKTYKVPQAGLHESGSVNMCPISERSTWDYSAILQAGIPDTLVKDHETRISTNYNTTTGAIHINKTHKIQNFDQKNPADVQSLKQHSSYNSQRSHTPAKQLDEEKETTFYKNCLNGRDRRNDQSTSHTVHPSGNVMPGRNTDSIENSTLLETETRYSTNTCLEPTQSVYFMNTENERVTLRKTPSVPQFTEEQRAPLNNRTQTSYADDLRETARNLIANSQKFSGLSNHGARLPKQKLNIGLAQPRKRDDISKESLSRAIMMQQSPWVSGNSPPMDLESDPPTPRPDSVAHLVNTATSLSALSENDKWNRVIYTSNDETPQKKRKLTFEAKPGMKKGQTKLVFK